MKIRKLTPIECERLQTLEDWYTEYWADGKKISDTQRYKALWNWWTCDVIAHIFKNIFKS
jgi:site-specific DNA-cytosine methylase